MKKTAAAVILGLGAVANLGIGSANADDESFLTAVEAPYLPGVEFQQPSDWLLATGYEICADTQAGKPQLRIIRDVRYNGDYTLSATEATVLVNTAQNELC